MLAQAFAELKTGDLELVMAGPCFDDSYRAELQRICGKQIHFTGMLQGVEKWGAFRCAEVFALPSHQENFGIAVVEALACGVPVLISAAVDIHATITAAGAGFAAKDNLTGTRELLERWRALSSSQREAMKTAATASFHDHFHIGETAKGMIALLEANTYF